MGKTFPTQHRAWIGWGDFVSSLDFSDSGVVETSTDYYAITEMVGVPNTQAQAR
jgi:hypothetical protein